ncbi:MAG: hypothetical protein J2P53_18595 [Bradyrhizobiaceae bacterium]|nr:hypothetical protein [Bradyrhizobiaceae bacterium]
MTHHNSNLDDADKLTPEQARIIARVRLLMLISGLATVLGIAVVVGIVGYRVFRTEGRLQAAAGVPVSAPVPVEATARLPKGARVVSVDTAGDRIVVTIDTGGTPEIRVFDAKSLSPAGRLRFTTEP